MKKCILYFCTGILMLSLVACGKGGQEESGSQGSENSGSQEAGGTGDGLDVTGGDASGTGSDAAGGDQASDGTSGAGGGQSSEEGSGEAGDSQVPDGSAGAPEEGVSGWSDEMGALRQAVVDVLGEENYWPDMPMDAEMLELFIGVAPDLYEDYMAESPMISGNVDSLVIIKAKEESADAVEEALNAYREANVNDTMQYPQNLGKIQASQVERIGNYVIFVQLGGYAIDEEEEEDVISLCKEANQSAIDAVRGVLEGN